MTKKEMAALKERVLAARALLYREIANYAQQAGVTRASGVIGYSMREIAAMALADPLELDKVARSTSRKVTMNPPIHQCLISREVQERETIDQVRILVDMVQN